MTYSSKTLHSLFVARDIKVVLKDITPLPDTMEKLVGVALPHQVFFKVIATGAINIGESSDFVPYSIIETTDGT